MTYCDPSILAPDCGSPTCSKCDKHRIKEGLHNEYILPSMGSSSQITKQTKSWEKRFDELLGASFLRNSGKRKTKAFIHKLLNQQKQEILSLIKKP